MFVSRLLRIGSDFPQIRWSSESYARKKLKGYIFPEIRKEDCEIKFIHGWGPGGSNVNKATNAVMLKHKPTKCVVKVHDSRLVSQNVKIAYERMKLEVDQALNADHSYINQFRQLEHEYRIKLRRAKERRRRIKESVEEENNSEKKL